MRPKQRGRVTGFSIASFLQLVSMEEKTCKVGVRTQETWGNFYFDKGRLFHAFFEGEDGEEAAMAMLRLKNMEIFLQRLPEKKPNQTIRNELMSLILNSTIAEDDDNAQKTQEQVGNGTIPRSKAESLTVPRVDRSEKAKRSRRRADGHAVRKKREAEIKKRLLEFDRIEGFMAVGVFSPKGEMIVEFNPTEQKLAQIGALANEVLLASQMATEIMKVGRGNLIHIQTPKAQVIARCLNEATDFTVTKKGRAHIHIVLIIGKEGNVAMGKMKLGAVATGLAAAFR